MALCCAGAARPAGGPSVSSDPSPLPAPHAPVELAAAPGRAATPAGAAGGAPLGWQELPGQHRAPQDPGPPAGADPSAAGSGGGEHVREHLIGVLAFAEHGLEPERRPEAGRPGEAGAAAWMQALQPFHGPATVRQATLCGVPTSARLCPILEFACAAAC